MFLVAAGDQAAPLQGAKESHALSSSLPPLASAPGNYLQTCLLCFSLQEIKAAPLQGAKESVGSSSGDGSSNKGSWGSSISSLLEDFADPSTLAFCGVVLGACATTLLVLGANAWLKSRK